MNHPPCLLNLGQLALALQLPLYWLEAEATAGRIPCLRIGRCLRFNVGAVEQALAERASHFLPARHRSGPAFTIPSGGGGG
jgi:hypothetical protein